MKFIRSLSGKFTSPVGTTFTEEHTILTMRCALFGLSKHYHENISMSPLYQSKNPSFLPSLFDSKLS